MKQKNGKWQWLWAVASVAAYIAAIMIFTDFHFKDGYYHLTIRGVSHFVLTLAIVMFNVRRLARPVRQIAVALLVATFAAVMMRYKVEYLQWWRYREIRIVLGFVFVAMSAVASLLPRLRDMQGIRLARAGKISLLAAVLMLDFAAAFPNVTFSEYDSEGIYMGYAKAETGPDKSRRKSLRTFGYAGQYWNGFNDIEDIQVLTPIDAEGRMYESRIYCHAWDSDYMVDTLTRDTIWLHGMWSQPDHKSMVNIELAALRHQWQYDMWHRLKRFFGKK